MKNSVERYLLNQIRKDIQKKMVFIGGPRQVGKTTLAQMVAPKESSYLSWDFDTDRQKILTTQLPQTKILIFDELHKFKRWRNWIKGVYDKLKEQHQIIVTGSAKLDYYRHGGDSLQGRYHYLRLHPLSVAELAISNKNDFLSLLHLGGFPEPFFSQSQTEAKRWSKEYRSKIIREDIATLEQLLDLDSVELLSMRLPDLVGSPLSLNALREDLQKSHKTVAHWVDILERLYSIFRLPIFGSPRIKAVKKVQKHYHFDWSLVEESGPRLENLLASHLLKWVHYKQDVEGEDFELRFFRDIEGREVDFVITDKKKVLMMIECKKEGRDISPHLNYLKAKFPESKALQLSMNPNLDFVSKGGVQVMPIWKFLKELI